TANNPGPKGLIDVDEPTAKVFPAGSTRTACKDRRQSRNSEEAEPDKIVSTNDGAIGREPNLASQILRLICESRSRNQSYSFVHVPELGHTQAPRLTSGGTYRDLGAGNQPLGIR